MTSEVSPNLTASPHFEALFGASPLPMAGIDASGLVIAANSALRDMLGDKTASLGWSLLAQAAHDEMAAMLSEGIGKIVLTLSLTGQNRQEIPCSVTVWPARDEGTAQEGIRALALVQDVSETIGLRADEARFRGIFDNAMEGIFQTTEDGHYLAANQALARIYGYETAAELIHNLTNIACQLYVDPTRRGEFIRLLESDDLVRNFESQVYTRHGEMIWISESCRAVRDEGGKLLYFEGLVEDITVRKRAEEQLIHDALHDSLTDLPNRSLFLDRLGRTMVRSARGGEKSSYAVLFIDCDRFKLINDSLGHLAGDRVLVEMAQRIQTCLRASDTLARLGGDEFVVLAESLDRPEDAVLVANRMRATLSLPFALDGVDHYLSTSVGIAYGDPAYSHASDLLRDADTAMYEAKANGRNRYVVFESGMHLTAKRQLEMTNDLRRAIEQHELMVYYQPIIDLAHRRVAGFESLIRWRHPSGEMIPPDRFIPIAEETGLIEPLGQFVLKQSCLQMVKWTKQFPASENTFISVNLSAAQLLRPDIVFEIHDTVQRTGLPCKRVRLEITESGIMKNPSAAKLKLDALKQLGFRLAIDDFGTGYSSLAHLHRFPIDTLKVDRSFVAPMLEQGDHIEIIRTIMTLGQSLNMSIVAEGVETEMHHDCLAEMNCTYGQGWLYAKAIPADEAGALLQAETLPQ